MRSRSRSRRPRGFTLIELLVVISIILIVGAATIPAVISLQGPRKVSEAARILQAALVGAHDAAIHANAPRGIRLIPDPTLPTGTLGYNRLIPIEPAPTYREGRVSIYSDTLNALSTTTNPTLNWPVPGTTVAPVGFLILWQAVTDPNNTLIINSPTSWYWNVRVGDRIQIGNTGRTYTVIGPQVYPYGLGNATTFPNPDGFVNIGIPGTLPAADPVTGNTNPEYLYLVNGVDDDGDGWIDPQWDGVDNNLNGTIDLLGVNPDPLEFEPEQWLTDVVANPILNSTYTITRRPIPVQSAREVMLPSGSVIDATAAFVTGERSRLPIDLNTFYVDIMIQPNGQVVPTTLYSSPANYGLAAAFYHFWITDREDVHEPSVQTNVPYLLPMPTGTPSYPNASDTAWTNTPLNGQRRLVTLFTRTGNIVTNSIEPAYLLPSGGYSSGFLGTDVNNPFIDAQSGVREAK